MDRNQKLRMIQQCLSSPEGKVLMAELGSILDPLQLFDSDPLVMAQLVAGRDVFKTLESFQRGDNVK